MPDKTLHFKGNKCQGGKNSKERITVLLTAFADGNLAKTMVIGKSKNPRCFKNIKKSDLPVHYKANSKAWMTAAIFTEYLQNLNKQMINEKRKIILFIDNARCHPDIMLSNIKLEFLPPNCTSVLQPLDGGIIQCLKVNYRKLMLKRIIAAITTVQNFGDLVKNITVLDAIMVLSNATKQISKVCVQKCFNHCGFPVLCESVDSTVDIDELQTLVSLHFPELSVRATDYVAIDNEVHTDTDCLDIANFLPVIGEESDEGQLETEEIVAIPEPEEIIKSLNNLKLYGKIKGNYRFYEVADQLNSLYDADVAKNCSELKQTSIKSFFKNM